MIMYFDCLPHAVGGNLPVFCRTRPLKLFRELNVGNHPILMEQNFRKISCDFKVVVFPMFFIQLCCETQPHHDSGKPHESHTKAQHRYR